MSDCDIKAGSNRQLFTSIQYLFVYGHHCQQSKDQSGKAANPARGQLNRCIGFFMLRSRLRVWSPDTGSVVPSRVSILLLHTEAESGTETIAKRLQQPKMISCNMYQPYGTTEQVHVLLVLVVQLVHVSTLYRTRMYTAPTHQPYHVLWNKYWFALSNRSTIKF